MVVTAGARIELELLDRSRNARRGYAMAVTLERQLSLFPREGGEDEPLVLVVVWGRLEGKRRVRRERFAARWRLAARWRELVGRRLRHGYAVTRLEGGAGLC